MNSVMQTADSFSDQADTAKLAAVRMNGIGSKLCAEHVLAIQAEVRAQDLLVHGPEVDVEGDVLRRIELREARALSIEAALQPDRRSG